MNRLARTEIGLAVASVGLALIASIYLVISLLAADQVCYGMTSSKLLCDTLQPGTTEYAQVAARLGFVVVTVLLLYVGTALGAWWHRTAKEPSARSAALGLLVTCALLAICMTVPAVSGAGFFYIPSTLAASAAAVIGLVDIVLASRPQAKEANSPEA